MQNKKHSSKVQERTYEKFTKSLEKLSIIAKIYYPDIKLRFVCMQDEITCLLRRHGQQKLIAFLEKKPDSSLIEQIQSLPPIPNPTPPANIDKSTLYNPLIMPSLSLSNQSNSRTGCLILAGGDGSRFRSSVPKSCVPLKELKGLSLLQYHLEKKTCDHPIIVLASRSNTDVIKEHLGSKWLSQVSVIEQPSYPVIDEDGMWMLKDKHTLLLAPGGNGYAITAIRKWQKDHPLHQVDCWSILPIDNPKGLMTDSCLTHSIIHDRKDLSVYAVKTAHLTNPVGLFAVQNNRLSIIDYHYSQSFDHLAYGNTNLFALSADLITREMDLPFHKVKKKSKILDYETGRYSENVVYKYEQFITDICPYANSFSVLLTSRSQRFLPIKSQKDLIDLQNDSVLR